MSPATSSTILEAGHDLGARILADLKESLSAEWDAIPDADKALAASVATDLGVLLALRAVGAPGLDAEIRHAKAGLANLGYVRAQAVERAFWAAAGRVVATLAKGLLAAI